MRMGQSVPKQLILIAAVAGVAFLALIAYGNLGPKTDPLPLGPVSLAASQSDLEELLGGVESTALTLSRCPPQPLQQDEARQRLRDAYGGEAPTVWGLFYGDDLDHPTPEPEYNQQGFFFPLIYHQGIEIESAYTEMVEGKRKLVIREVYTGGEPLLEGFRRDNIFFLEGGEWRFHSFQGTVSIQDEALFSTYLPLKEGAACPV